ncbi:T9SS type B sorting domain-containing protein [Allomuricauda sp. F6463D]|uniref:T9SS type B sorting domain-containing protein n=1 Tax=Allomuricauda sp. F6463D TaxID=2926409 RepID=UPI001FF33788|nr:T9SS type B sorting domain-containing protein [Muricauda sp. F6463D]MCK0160132.1 T9SS type B sorting domain-containing protein [Muricauda sp. F6463D]
MNLRKITFCSSLFLLLSSVGAQAQNRANHWYFGYNAGVDFNSGSPVAVTYGQLFTDEGCATISDNGGNLLFYTDGINVYNKDHQLMPNGTGLFGDSSSTHSAIIVPVPGSLTLYYIFTVDVIIVGATIVPTDGLQYSIVDMSLDGGLGDVSVKNIQLMDKIPERVAAYKKKDSDDYWVISQRYDSNEFVAFEVTATGISNTPVISAVGAGNGPYYRITGQIKISPDGTRLATANGWEVEIFDFDETTGEISNPVTVPVVNPYGVEFSPNNRLLYVNYYEGVCQFDLEAGTESDVQNSKVILKERLGESFGSLQLGPDGKIYGVKVRKEYLDIIHNPNALGTACDYRYDDLYLNGMKGFLGLPTFISNISSLKGNIDFENTCLGELTEFSTAIDNPLATFLWDFGDGNTSIDTNPSHTYAATGTYDVTLTVTEGARINTESIKLTISEVPEAIAVTDVEVCSLSDTHIFDLSTLDAQVLDTQDANAYQVTYFANQSDADNNVNALPSELEFDRGTITVFARVSNGNDFSCFDTTSFDVIVKLAPQLFNPTDWIVCDDDSDGTYSFDLAAKDVEILNGQDKSVFNVSYYDSQSDADNGTNPLNADHSVSVMSETIFYRIENTTYPECFETGRFTVGVIDQVVANKPTNLEICDPDNDGTAQFNLSDVDSEVLGTQSASSVILSYHESQADADGNIAPLPNVITSNQYQKTIYVRVSNAQNILCYDTNSFQLNIYDVPEVPEVSNWLVCDNDNDGQYTFDLDQKADEIAASLSGTSHAFYESEADASLEQNPIYGNYQNTSNPQTVYFRLNNSNNTACYAVGSFDIEVFDAPTAYPPSDIVLCNDAETGSFAIDLSQKDSEVLNGQDISTYEVTYYPTEQNAIIGGEKLAKEEYFNVAMTETIYARVEHKDLSSCYDITNFDLIVNPLPSSNLQEIFVICPDSPDLVLDAGTFESYLWEYADGNVIGNGQTLNVNQLGTYFLTVTETKNGVSCSSTVSFEVLSSGAPESFEVTTDGFSDRVTMTVEAFGTGDFEYSIDGWTYQSSNQFEVFPGEYTVYVRDPLGCRTISEEVIAIGYQKFFSPNGDGINENWNIIGGELYSDAQLFLYDRYGKLLVQLSPQGSGWDGTILGRPMPSTDYWFKYVYDNGKTYTGHFSLRR